MKKLFFLGVIFFMVQNSFAANDLSLGILAGNITEPIQIVSGFVSVACLIIGIACLFAAFVKYFEHRRSELAVPISTVIWLLIIGILLLILPFAYKITENGIPFSVLWGGLK